MRSRCLWTAVAASDRADADRAGVSPVRPAAVSGLRPSLLIHLYVAAARTCSSGSIRTLRHSENWTNVDLWDTCSNKPVARLPRPTGRISPAQAENLGEVDGTRRAGETGGRTAGKGYLTQFAWTKIVRHTMVKGTASPDDPNLNDYWKNRRSKRRPPLMTTSKVYLAARQKGLCPLCRTDLIQGADYEPDNVQEWVEWFEAKRSRLHEHHLVYRSHGGSDDRSNLRLVHAECHRLHYAGDGARSLQQPTISKQGRSCDTPLRRSA